MAYRVSEAQVREIIDVPETLSLNAFIIAANLMVDQHLAASGMSAALLQEIERWLAAHFVAIRVPSVRSRSMGDARETYAISGGYSGGLDATPYGQQAMTLDYTGALSSTIGKKAVTVEAIEEDYS